MTSNQRKLEAYREQNEQTAKVILADIAKYGGAESLMVIWATAVVVNASQARPQKERA